MPPATTLDTRASRWDCDRCDWSGLLDGAVVRCPHCSGWDMTPIVQHPPPRGIIERHVADLREIARTTTDHSIRAMLRGIADDIDLLNRTRRS